MNKETWLYLLVKWSESAVYHGFGVLNSKRDLGIMVAHSVIIYIKCKDGRHQFLAGVILIAPACVKTS